MVDLTVESPMIVEEGLEEEALAILEDTEEIEKTLAILEDTEETEKTLVILEGMKEIKEKILANTEEKIRAMVIPMKTEDLAVHVSLRIKKLLNQSKLIYDFCSNTEIKMTSNGSKLANLKFCRFN